MDIRYSIAPQNAEQMNTEALRAQFLLEDLFADDLVRWVYAQDDRALLGGCVPYTEVRLEADSSVIGGPNLLERREVGVFNLGGEAEIAVGTERYQLGPLDALYVGRTTEPVILASKDTERPARLYLVSTPAHREYPTTAVTQRDAEAVELGSQEAANRRTLRKYIFPGGAASCQLVMGFTRVHEGSVWNTMPCHTHLRRMEAYLYFDLAADAVAFHLMGRPTNTRHLVVRNEQAVISPPWSIHSGAATASYSFVWAMAGENQEFTDMDAVPVETLA